MNLLSSPSASHPPRLTVVFLVSLLPVLPVPASHLISSSANHPPCRPAILPVGQPSSSFLFYLSYRSAISILCVPVILPVGQSSSCLHLPVELLTAVGVGSCKPVQEPLSRPEWPKQESSPSSPRLLPRLLPVPPAATCTASPPFHFFSTLVCWTVVYHRRLSKIASINCP